MASKHFENGKNCLIEYLNGLVKSEKAVFIGEENEDYCERHETCLYRWNYKLNEGNSDVRITVGPLSYSIDHKSFEKFSLTIVSADKSISEKLMNDLEKVIGNK